MSAATPEAARAGAEVLARGGNAADAAAAVGLVLGVTEPMMSGLGGQSQMLVYRSGQPPLVLNGTSLSPAATPDGATEDDLVGHRATTVPTTLAVLGHAHETLGSGRVSWRDVVAPAIRHARDGFVVGRFRHDVWARKVEALAAHASTRALFLTSEGVAPAQGSVFRQPVLARTLERIAARGWEAFYRGDMAQAIARDVAAGGGWMTADDLARVGPPARQAPLHATYRGHDVYSLPPPGGGWVVLKALGILERTPVERLRADPALRVGAVAAALHAAHLDRRDHPIRDLVRYEREVDEKLGRGETTHYTVVDADGMAVSVTASINGIFGAKVAHPELGFLYNDYMREFEVGASDHPFELRGRAMPYSSMSPTIVAREGRAVLALGSPGSARIISAIVQVVHHWLDLELPVEQAVARGRLHPVPDGELFIETVADREVAGPVDGLKVVPPPGRYEPVGELTPYFGGVHAVAYERGRWRGAFDPRRDGAAATAP